MWRAEFRTALKYTGLWLAMIALAGAVSLVGLLSRQGWLRVGLLFYVSAMGLILFFPVLLGYSAFREERAQRGMEYALSLPLPRRRLLAAKLVPRLAVLVVASTLFLLCLEPVRRLFLLLSDLSPALYWGAGFLLITLFLLSLPFSLWQESVLVTLILTVFSLVIYVGIVGLLFYGFHFALRALRIEALPLATFAGIMLGKGFKDFSPSPILIGAALILLVPFFLAFVLTVRDLDLRPRRSWKIFVSRLGMLCLAGVVVSAAFIGFAYEPAPSDLELIDDRHLVETKPGFLSVRTLEGKSYYFPGNPMELSAIGGNEREIYFWDYYDGAEHIWAFRKDGGKWQVIYSAPPGYAIRELLMRRPERYDFIIEIRDKNANEPAFQLISLDLNRRITTSNVLAFPKKGNPYRYFVLGTDIASGRRYWLLSSIVFSELKNIYRIWEDGQIDILPFSLNSRRLFFRGYLFAIADQEMVVMDALDPAFKIVRKIEGRFSYFVRGPDGPLDTGGDARFLVADQDDILYCLDLSDWSFSKLENAPTPSNRDHYYRISNNLIRLSSYPSERMLTLFRLTGCRLEPLVTIEGRGPRQLSDDEWISNAGIVVRRKGKIRAYPAPDMKEIHFK